MCNIEPKSAQSHIKNSRTGKRRAAKKEAALAKIAQQTNTPNLAVASSSNAYNTSAPVCLNAVNGSQYRHLAIASQIIHHHTRLY